MSSTMLFESQVASITPEEWLYREKQKMLATEGLGAKNLLPWQGSVYGAFGLNSDGLQRRGQQDLGLSQHGDQQLPSLIIQSCWAHEYKQMFNEMRTWMKFAAGAVQMAILLKWSIAIPLEGADPVLHAEIEVFEYVAATRGRAGAKPKKTLHEIISSTEERQLRSVNISSKHLYAGKGPVRPVPYTLNLNELWAMALDIFDAEVEGWNAEGRPAGASVQITLVTPESPNPEDTSDDDEKKYDTESIEEGSTGALEAHAVEKRDDVEKASDKIHDEGPQVGGVNRSAPTSETTTDQSSEESEKSNNLYPETPQQSAQPRDFRSWNEAISNGHLVHQVEETTSIEGGTYTVTETAHTREYIAGTGHTFRLPASTAHDQLQEINPHTTHTSLEHELPTRSASSRQSHKTVTRSTTHVHVDDAPTPDHSSYSHAHEGLVEEVIIPENTKSSFEVSITQDAGTGNAKTETYEITYDQTLTLQQPTTTTAEFECPHCISKQCCHGPQSPLRLLPQNFMSAGVIGPFSLCGFVVHLCLSTHQPLPQEIVEEKRPVLIHQLLKFTEETHEEFPPEEEVGPLTLTTAYGKAVITEQVISEETREGIRIRETKEETGDITDGSPAGSLGSCVNDLPQPEGPGDIRGSFQSPTNIFPSMGALWGGTLPRPYQGVENGGGLGLTFDIPEPQRVNEGPKKLSETEEKKIVPETVELNITDGESHGATKGETIVEELNNTIPAPLTKNDATDPGATSPTVVPPGGIPVTERRYSIANSRPDVTEVATSKAEPSAPPPEYYSESESETDDGSGCVYPGSVTLGPVKSKKPGKKWSIRKVVKDALESLGTKKKRKVNNTLHHENGSAVSNITSTGTDHDSKTPTGTNKDVDQSTIPGGRSPSDKNAGEHSPDHDSGTQTGTTKDVDQSTIPGGRSPSDKNARENSPDHDSGTQTGTTKDAAIPEEHPPSAEEGCGGMGVPEPLVGCGGMGVPEPLVGCGGMGKIRVQEPLVGCGGMGGRWVPERPSLRPIVGCPIGSGKKWRVQESGPTVYEESWESETDVEVEKEEIKRVQSHEHHHITKADGDREGSRDSRKTTSTTVKHTTDCKHFHTGHLGNVQCDCGLIGIVKHSSTRQSFHSDGQCDYRVDTKKHATTCEYVTTVGNAQCNCGLDTADDTAECDCGVISMKHAVTCQHLTVAGYCDCELAGVKHATTCRSLKSSDIQCESEEDTQTHASTCHYLTSAGAQQCDCGVNAVTHAVKHSATCQHLTLAGDCNCEVSRTHTSTCEYVTTVGDAQCNCWLDTAECDCGVISMKHAVTCQHLTGAGYCDCELAGMKHATTCPSLRSSDIHYESEQDTQTHASTCYYLTSAGAQQCDCGVNAVTHAVKHSATCQHLTLAGDCNCEVSKTHTSTCEYITTVGNAQCNCWLDAVECDCGVISRKHAVTCQHLTGAGYCDCELAGVKHATACPSLKSSDTQYESEQDTQTHASTCYFLTSAGEQCDCGVNAVTHAVKHSATCQHLTLAGDCNCGVNKTHTSRCAYVVSVGKAQCSCGVGVAHISSCQYITSNGIAQCDCGVSNEQSVKQETQGQQSTTDLMAQLQSLLNKLQSQNVKVSLPSSLGVNMGCEFSETVEDEMEVQIEVKVKYKSSRSTEHVGICEAMRRKLGAVGTCAITGNFLGRI